MYMNNSYTSSATDKPVTQLACYTLTGLAIILAAIAFWAKGFVPAALMTVAFAAVSFLLAGSVLRFAEAMEKGHKVTAGLTVAMGFVCLCLEAGMTHYGLAHLNAQYGIAPAWALWPVSFGLSAFNVFSQYTFSRELKAKAKPVPVVAPPVYAPPPVAKAPKNNPPTWEDTFFASDYEAGIRQMVERVRTKMEAARS